MAIIGGIAVNANGVARTTADIDATTPGADLDVAELHSALRKEGFRPRISDAVRFARQNQVLLLEHVETGIELDLSLAWLSPSGRRGRPAAAAARSQAAAAKGAVMV